MKNAGNGDMTLEFSTDGINFIPVSDWVGEGNSWGLVNNGTPIPLPEAAENAAQIRFRWSYTSTVLNFTTSFYAIDDILITGEPIAGLSTFSWQNRPVGEDPFLVSSPGSKDPYSQDNVTMRWTKTVDPGVNLTGHLVSNSRIQSANSLTLVQSGAAAGNKSTTVRLSLNQPVLDFAFSLWDVDRSAGQFLDQVVIQGYLAGNPVALSKNKVQTTSYNQLDPAQSSVSGNPSGSEAGNATQEGNVQITFPSAVDQVAIT